MNEDQKNIIKQKLLERAPVIECPICHHRKFVLLDGYLTENLQDDYHSVVVGGENIVPTIAIACKHCGYVSQFALGALGLLPDSIENLKMQESEVSDKKSKSNI